MSDLKSYELGQVNGGLPPLLVFFAGEALYVYSVYQTAKWLGEK